MAESKPDGSDGHRKSQRSVANQKVNRRKTSGTGSPGERSSKQLRSDPEWNTPIVPIIAPPAYRACIQTLIGGFRNQPERIRSLFVEAVKQFANRAVREPADDLGKLADDPDLMIRQLAVHTMFRLASAGPWLASRFEPWIFNALIDKDNRNRAALTDALRWYAAPRHRSHAKAFELADRLLRDADPKVRLRTLEALPAFDIERVSSRIDRLLEVLQDDEAGVRKAASTVLGWLGVDALEAIRPLTVCAAVDPDQKVKRAAATALLAIDPGADGIDIGPNDERVREGLLETLRALGSEAREFRRRLQATWRADGTEPEKSGLGAQVPPSLSDVWHDLTETHRMLLDALWRNRRTEGLKFDDFAIGLSIFKASTNPVKLVSTHLAKIRKIIAGHKKRRVPFFRKHGRFYWR